MKVTIGYSFYHLRAGLSPVWITLATSGTADKHGEKCDRTAVLIESRQMYSIDKAITPTKSSRQISFSWLYEIGIVIVYLQGNTDNGSIPDRGVFIRCNLIRYRAERFLQYGRRYKAE